MGVQEHDRRPTEDQQPAMASPPRRADGGATLSSIQRSVGRLLGFKNRLTAKIMSYTRTNSNPLLHYDRTRMDSLDWLRVAKEHFSANRLQDAEQATIEATRADPN